MLRIFLLRLSVIGAFIFFSNSLLSMDDPSGSSEEEPELIYTPHPTADEILLECSARGDKKELDRLLDKGGNRGFKPSSIDICNSKDKTPLYLAARFGHTEIVRLLLDRGPSINRLCGKFDETALHVACQYGHWEVVELLLARKASVRAVDCFGRTPLHAVLRASLNESEREKVAHLLLRDGADPDAVSYDGEIPLHMALANGELQVVRALLSQGANPDAADNQGRTPLQILAEGGLELRIRFVKLLLARKAKTNVVNANGRTLLHVAAGNGQSKILKLLLAAGADINAVDSQGRTPLRLALQGGHEDVVRLLRYRSSAVASRVARIYELRSRIREHVPNWCSSSSATVAAVMWLAFMIYVVNQQSLRPS